MNTTYNKNGAEKTSNIEGGLPRNMRLYTELDSNGQLVSRKLTAYECQLEDDVQHLQEALFTISSQYAKIQFRLRQISSATAGEKISLLKELEDVATQGVDGRNCTPVGELPSLRCDSTSLGNVRAKQQKIICQLRDRLEDLADATGACFQADTTERSTNQTIPFGIIEQENVKNMTKEKPKVRYLSEIWTGNSNSKGEYSCKGRPKSGKKLERSDKRQHELSSVATHYHS